MNQLKIITFLESLCKVLLVISLLVIGTGVVVHFLDVYNVFRNSFFIGIPLFLFSLIFYLVIRALRRFKTKQPIFKLVFLVLLVSAISFGLYVVFGKIIEAISH
ncbi:hypothetical protein SAMN05660313_01403 [Cellulophaga fucicola]|uniref:Uncharacterized protein n=1 Tax=Cellulophaga fucicola TaxID=76595 RepID=A0A1K1NVP4_9FLAO|nr:hypothetical protein SAMN05660313_01403 [Cellulophaga fucicola]